MGLLKTVFFLLPLLYFHYLPFFSLFILSVMEAKRSQSISNCVHLYEALPTTKSVPMLLHTVSSFLPGISSGNSACSHRLSGKVDCESFLHLYLSPLHCISHQPLTTLWFYVRIRATFCFAGLKKIKAFTKCVQVNFIWWITRICEPFASPLHVTCHHFFSPFFIPGNSSSSPSL